jgi:hypothetical protein
MNMIYSKVTKSLNREMKCTLSLTPRRIRVSESWTLLCLSHLRSHLFVHNCRYVTERQCYWDLSLYFFENLINYMAT